MPKWTVIVDDHEFAARPLILAAAGVAPNDATNSHMAIAKLKALGFETRYAGQEHSGQPPELVTTFEGKELAHRGCWEVVLEQQRLADSHERGWYRPSLVAMVFAFHAVEAYLNFVTVWRDMPSCAQIAVLLTGSPLRAASKMRFRYLIWDGDGEKCLDPSRSPTLSGVSATRWPRFRLPAWRRG